MSLLELPLSIMSTGSTSPEGVRAVALSRPLGDLSFLFGSASTMLAVGALGLLSRVEGLLC